MNASAGGASKVFVKDKPCFTNRQRKKRSFRGCIKVLRVILAKTQIKILKKNQVWNSKVWASGDEIIKTIPGCIKRLFLVLFKS
jgi:hypothetical protein